MPSSVFQRQGGMVKARNHNHYIPCGTVVPLSMGSNLADSNILFLRTAPVQFGRRGGIEIKMKEKPMPQLKKNSSSPDKIKY